MDVAIFGGSFNPPHVAHQLACAFVLATSRCDQVWMLPTFKHPFDKQLAPFEDRVTMCERAAQVFGGKVHVSRLEEELGGESFTLRTVKELQTRFARDRFRLVIGADLVAERERWHGWTELKERIEFIVVGRSGESRVAEAVGIEMPRVSSTEVRERLARGASVDGLVDANVLDYIHEKGLYSK
jgi:nicotinate-nucleotide adenylyltransferase